MRCGQQPRIEAHRMDGQIVSSYCIELMMPVPTPDNIGRRPTTEYKQRLMQVLVVQQRQKPVWKIRKFEKTASAFDNSVIQRSLFRKSLLHRKAGV